MRIVLTSTGFENKKIAERILKELKKDAKECRVLMVSYAQTNKEKYYLNLSHREILEIGFSNVAVMNMDNPFPLPYGPLIKIKSPFFNLNRFDVTEPAFLTKSSVVFSLYEQGVRGHSPTPNTET